jgi:hypothetical protein
MQQCFFCVFTCLVGAARAHTSLLMIQVHSHQPALDFYNPLVTSPNTNNYLTLPFPSFLASFSAVELDSCFTNIEDSWTSTPTCTSTPICKHAQPHLQVTGLSPPTSWKNWPHFFTFCAKVQFLNYGRSHISVEVKAEVKNHTQLLCSLKWAGFLTPKALLLSGFLHAIPPTDSSWALWRTRGRENAPE